MVACGILAGVKQVLARISDSKLGDAEPPNEPVAAATHRTAARAIRDLHERVAGLLFCAEIKLKSEIPAYFYSPMASTEAQQKTKFFSTSKLVR